MAQRQDAASRALCLCLPETEMRRLFEVGGLRGHPVPVGVDTHAAEYRQCAAPEYD